MSDIVQLQIVIERLSKAGVGGIFTPTDLRQLVTLGNEAIDELAALRERVAEAGASFELRWAADQRAIKLWQEATGKNMMWPNHTDLCVWLMEQLAEAGKWEDVPEFESVACESGARRSIMVERGEDRLTMYSDYAPPVSVELPDNIRLRRRITKGADNE